MKKYFLKIFVLVFVLISAGIFIPSLSSADTNNAKEQRISLPIERIKPGNFYYPAKRAWEKLRIKLIFSLEKKIDYRELLLKKRLSELKYIAEEKKLDVFENASYRFSYEAGELTNLIEKLGDDEKTRRYIEEFDKYVLVLPSFRDLYPANTSNWLLIQQNIDTLRFLQERLE